MYRVSKELKKEFLENHDRYGDLSALEVLKKEQQYFSESQLTLYHCVMLLNELLDCYECNYDGCGLIFDTKYYFDNKLKLLESLGINL